MTKALLKKEFSQIKKMYLTNRRKGGQGGKGVFILLIVCYFLVMISMGALDSAFAFELIPIGYGWLYYFFVLAMSFVVGIIGSIFTTAEMLFKAKDNEILLAMPIPPSKILFSRMVGVYIMGLIYELIVLFPGVILYVILAGPTVLNILFGILGMVLLGFIILAFSCFFGWIVAIITAKLKNKNILTVIIAVVFIGLFMFIRFKMNDFFRDLIMNAEAIGDALKGWGYPLYAPALGMTGNIVGMLIFLGVAGVLFGVTYWIISRSFNKIINIKPSEKKAQFKDSQIVTSGLEKALYRKELRRFLSSPNYMLNCGLGILFLAAGAIASLIASGSIKELAANLTRVIPGGANLIVVIGAFAVCVLCGFIDISAPSISLEGPSIWILQSMPVSASQVLKAKFKLAVLFAGIPAVVCAAVVMIVVQADIAAIILGVLCAGMFAVTTSLLGLRLDLRRPFLDWTNEVQPVKQSMSVLFTMLIGMLGPLVPIALYIALASIVPPAVYLAVWTVLFALFSFLLFNWLRKKGTAKFATLGQ
ncbi:MAG: hypothetical protein IKH67_02590 [Lachnospiraceae bacterium]|nr:hypothetical protein [Lachnospiraceae bacterium]